MAESILGGYTMKEKTEKITLTGDEIEAIYGVDKGTLANLLSKRLGCPYYKQGRRCYYKKSDWETYFFSNPVLTSDFILER
jgi:hypothetical protein